MITRPIFSAPINADQYLKPEANPLLGLDTPDLPHQQLDWQTGMVSPDYDWFQSNYGDAPGTLRRHLPIPDHWLTNKPLTTTWEGIDYGPSGQPDPDVRHYEELVKYGHLLGGPEGVGMPDDSGLSYSMFATPEEIRTQQVTDMLPTGSSGMPSFDQYATTESRGSRFHGNPDDQYGQFRRKQMNMSVEPGQQRMTMTTDPRSKFDKEGFNSGMQIMNMGLGLLD